jgi:hypothetical protein
MLGGGYEWATVDFDKPKRQKHQIIEYDSRLNSQQLDKVTTIPRKKILAAHVGQLHPEARLHDFMPD